MKNKIDHSAHDIFIFTKDASNADSLFSIGNIQGGAKVITRCSFGVIFLMKNFDSACEISLLNPSEFIPSSRKNDIG